MTPHRTVGAVGAVTATSEIRKRLQTNTNQHSYAGKTVQGVGAIPDDIEELSFTFEHDCEIDRFESSQPAFETCSGSLLQYGRFASLEQKQKPVRLVVRATERTNSLDEPYLVRLFVADGPWAMVEVGMTGDWAPATGGETYRKQPCESVREVSLLVAKYMMLVQEAANKEDVSVL